jgi:hypothetical protein
VGREVGFKIQPADPNTRINGCHSSLCSPKNKEAYTAAPLQNLEHEADAFDLSDDEDDCVVAPFSVVVPADHGLGRGDGGPEGRRFCWSGVEVVVDHPEPTGRTLRRHDTTSLGGGASGIAGLAGRTSDSARCAVSSTVDCGGGKVAPG